MKTAWVLRGGAAFGAAQVGMAQALLEAGHHPDMLFGTSAGALNAAWLAADPTIGGLEGLARLWASARRRDVFPLRPFDAASGLLGRADHLASSAPLRKWLRKVCPLRQLEDGVLPLSVVTTDIETGEEILLDHGPAVPALLASSAMPGVFPPVRWGPRWLVDGSVASDTPIAPAVEAGATRVWVLPSVPVGPMSKPRTALDMLLRTTGIVLARHHDFVVETWKGRCELRALPAPLVPGTSPFSFGKSLELIDAGYRFTSEWLQAQQPVGPAPRGAPLAAPSAAVLRPRLATPRPRL